MPAPATQPAPSPRRFDRNLILARERERCVGRLQSLRAILAHERRKTVRSAWYEQHIRLELLATERRESRIDYDQRLLALPFAERRAKVGAPFVELYEGVTR